MGKVGHFPLPWKCCKVLFVLHILYKVSKQSIYALFWENVASLWGLCPRPSPGLCPWTLLGGFRPSNPLIAHPLKNPAGTKNTNTTTTN